MSGTSIEEPLGHAHLPNDGWAGERWAAASRARDRKFWIGLAVAILVHALLLIGIGTSAPQSLGSAGGAEDTISIDLVTQADLDSTATVAEQKAGDPEVPVSAAPPEQPPAAAPTPPEPQTDAQPETPSAPQPETPPETQPETQPAPQPETPSEAKPEQQQSILPDVAENLPDLLSESLPGEAPKKNEAAAKPKPQPKPPERPQDKPPEKPQEKRTARLDLSPPKSAPNAPSGGGGGSAGFERPPNITRSGENDAFGRRVIAALQKSMPPHSGIYGRLTVRIVLKQDGNVAEVKVIKTSAISVLDDVVLFAARQTPYPFPAPNSKDVDRIFFVTYNYR